MSMPRALLPVLLAVVTFSASCGGEDPNPVRATPNVPFSVVDLRAGTGAEAVNGSRLTVNYTGWLYDAALPENKGAQFDRGQFAFTLGAGQVISGFDQGVRGMRVGGLRRIVVPPAQGYGATGVPGVIPPNATLIFEVELVGLE
jgi:FKBP-type peptidyl-prolyl cis-trans isomerase FkpA